MGAEGFNLRQFIQSRSYFNPQTVQDDIKAGLVLGIESIPDGMASGLLAAVNPIYGVYGYMVGVTTGALFTSSVFMSVQGTGAMALVVASAALLGAAGLGDIGRHFPDSDGCFKDISSLTLLGVAINC